VRKANPISPNVIRRLPRYLRKLDELNEAGVGRVSSGELGRQLGLTPSQIRQDFSCFGEFGQQGYGYKVTALRSEIAGILGMDRGFSAILIGVGNIGQALMCNFDFHAWGFELEAAFDVKPELVGTEVEGVSVHHVDELVAYIKENHVDAVVLCVPKQFAVSTTEVLTANGIKAIWNFTNVELISPESQEGIPLEDRTVVENVHFSDSLLTLSYSIAENIDKRAAKAAKLRK